MLEPQCSFPEVRWEGCRGDVAALQHACLTSTICSSLLTSDWEGLWEWILYRQRGWLRQDQATSCPQATCTACEEGTKGREEEPEERSSHCQQGQQTGLHHGLLSEEMNWLFAPLPLAAWEWCSLCVALWKLLHRRRTTCNLPLRKISCLLCK